MLLKLLAQMARSRRGAAKQRSAQRTVARTRHNRCHWSVGAPQGSKPGAAVCRSRWPPEIHICFDTRAAGNCGSAIGRSSVVSQHNPRNGAGYSGIAQTALKSINHSPLNCFRHIPDIVRSHRVHENDEWLMWVQLSSSCLHLLLARTCPSANVLWKLVHIAHYRHAPVNTSICVTD